MKGREFITLLGGTAARPLAAQAQERGRVYRLGCLLPTEASSSAWMAFLDELRLNGFIEGETSQSFRAVSTSGESRLMPRWTRS